ncbi:unnamed protein product [Tilletia controversa]|nr:unnamed protein product [Tilletia controversa]
MRATRLFGKGGVLAIVAASALLPSSANGLGVQLLSLSCAACTYTVFLTEAEINLGSLIQFRLTTGGPNGESKAVSVSVQSQGITSSNTFATITTTWATPFISSGQAQAVVTPTSTISPSSDSDQSNGGGSNVGAIAGGAVGGILVLALLGFLLLFCLRRKKKNQEPMIWEGPSQSSGGEDGKFFNPIMHDSSHVPPTVPPASLAAGAAFGGAAPGYVSSTMDAHSANGNNYDPQANPQSYYNNGPAMSNQARPISPPMSIASGQPSYPPLSAASPETSYYAPSHQQAPYAGFAGALGVGGPSHQASPGAGPSMTSHEFEGEMPPAYPAGPDSVVPGPTDAKTGLHTHTSEDPAGPSTSKPSGSASDTVGSSSKAAMAGAAPTQTQTESEI